VSESIHLRKEKKKQRRRRPLQEWRALPLSLSASCDARLTASRLRQFGFCGGNLSRQTWLPTPQTATRLFIWHIKMKCQMKFLLFRVCNTKDKQVLCLRRAFFCY
jgi:hypothetical protein